MPECGAIAIKIFSSQIPSAPLQVIEYDFCFEVMFSVRFVESYAAGPPIQTILSLPYFPATRLSQVAGDEIRRQ